MKYVITGSLGNISKPVAEQLVKAGHDVTVITHRAENQSAIEALGAKAAVGTVEDAAFLAQIFAGADAVYTMVPPKWDAPDWKGYIGSIGANYAEAIRQANVKYVVNLSSIGAHLPDGCGPVSGLYRVEQHLNALEGVHVKHLRPAYFYGNLFSNIGMIKQAGIIGGNYALSEKAMPIVHTDDIAKIAAGHLLQLNFSGKTSEYIASDEVSTTQIAATLGAAIGKPELPWVQFTAEQTLQGMTGMGLPEEAAKNYVEMGEAMHSGKMGEDYFNNRPAQLGAVKLEDFAKTFAYAYNAN